MNCKSNLAAMAASGQWSSAFRCLGIDPDSLIQLGSVRVPTSYDDSWIDKQRNTCKILQVIRALLTLASHIFYICLLYFWLLCVYKLLRDYAVKKIRTRRVLNAATETNGNKSTQIEAKTK